MKLPIVGVILLISVIPSATHADDDEKRPLPMAFVGDWVGVAIEYCGNPVSDEIVQQCEFTITLESIKLAPLLKTADGSFTIQGDPTEVRCEHDPTVDPKAIDLIWDDDGKDRRMLGIYSIEDGLLKICWQHDGKARPSGFETQPEPSQILFVLKRR